MDILDRCIKESQRMYPAVPVIGRNIEHDLELEPGKIVPAGSRLEIYFISLHRDPKHWPNPSIFDPKRFLPENIAKRHPFAFCPFSAGPRNCIGQKYAVMELKLVAARVLSHFTVACTQTEQDIQPTISMVLRADQPVLVTFTKR